MSVRGARPSPTAPSARSAELLRPRGLLARPDASLPGPHRARRERLNTFLARRPEAARAAAAAADARLGRGEGADRPLLGIPYALKDIFVTRALDDDGGRSPAGCRRPPARGSWRDIGRRTRPRRKSGSTAAGAVLLGKTNCDEFAMGSSTRTAPSDRPATPGTRSTVPGGIVGRLGGGGRRGPGVLRPRHRHRRVDPPAGLALRASSA